MTYEEAKNIFIAHIVCDEKTLSLDRQKRCDGECDSCPVLYEKGTYEERKEAYSIAIDAINCCIERI